MIEINKTAAESKATNDEDSKMDKSEPTGSNTPTNRSAKLSKALVATSLIISVIALGTSGWLYYQGQQNQTQAKLSALQGQQDSFNAELNTYNKTFHDLAKLSGHIAQSERAFKQQAGQLQAQQSQQQNHLLSLENRVRQINNANKEDWKLAEAEYLVRLANQRLLLESDLNGAEVLLSNADEILAALDDPLFFDARKAIANDIQSLKSTSHFDVEGRYLQLGALYDQVEQLPQREPSKQWQQSNNQTEPSNIDEVGSQVGNALTNAWHSIKSLVIINYNQKPLKNLLPPTQYQQLITGLQLQIDVAQVAMIKGQTSIYQKALSRIAQSVTNHFDTRAQSVSAFMTSLTSLQQVNPAPKLPLPRNSLMAMKKLMASWNSRPEKAAENDQHASPAANKDIVTPANEPETAQDKKQGAQA